MGSRPAAATVVEAAVLVAAPAVTVAGHTARLDNAAALVAAHAEAAVVPPAAVAMFVFGRLPNSEHACRDRTSRRLQIVLCRVSPRPGLQAARRSARRVQKRKSFVFGRAAGWEPGLSSVRSMRFLDAAAETVRSPDTIAAPASAWWRKTSVSKHCAGWGCLFCEGCAFQSPSASRCRVGSRSASDFVHALDEVPQQSLASTCSLDPAPCSWRAAPPCAVLRWCTGPCTGSARIIPWQPSAEPSRGRNGGNFASLPKTEAYRWLVGMGCGGSGIRTHDTVSGVPALQASALDHSAIPPRAGT